MPNAFLSIETNFPTFNRDQKPEDKIDSMVNYLFILVEQLRYTLNNLDTKNFNQTALETFAEDTTADVKAGVETVATQLNQTNQSVSGLARRVGILEGLPPRVSELEDAARRAGENIGALQENVLTLQGSDEEQTRRLTELELWRSGTDNDGAEADIRMLKTSVGSMAGSITALQQSVAALTTSMNTLLGVLTVDGGGNVALGNQGRDTNLKGNIKFNGEPVT